MFRLEKSHWSAAVFTTWKTNDLFALGIAVQFNCSECIAWKWPQVVLMSHDSCSTRDAPLKQWQSSQAAVQFRELWFVNPVYSRRISTQSQLLENSAQNNSRPTFPDKRRENKCCENKCCVILLLGLQVGISIKSLEYFHVWTCLKRGRFAYLQSHGTAEHQCCRLSRNDAYVTPKIIHFNHKKIQFPDQSILK